MRPKWFLLICFLLISTAPAPLWAQSDYAAKASEGKLHFTFIGNESFAITDGEITLMTDYPYVPGVGGFMWYDVEATRPRGYTICLVTHAHTDHYRFSAYIRRSWAMVAPEVITVSLVGYDVTTASDGELLDVEGIHILPITTPHQDVDHFSYLVTWHGVRMYFTGDTDAESYLLEARDLDVAFVTPWLLMSIQQQGGKIDAKQVIVYHHKVHEDVVEFAGRVLPAQGDSFEIDFREPDATSQ